MPNNFADPTADGTTQTWTRSTGTSTFALLDDGVRQPSAPTTGSDRITSATAGNQADVKTFRRAAGATFTWSATDKYTLWVHCGTASESKREIQYALSTNGGTSFGTLAQLLAVNLSERWVSKDITAVVNSQANLDALAVRFQHVSTGGGSSGTAIVNAVYVQQAAITTITLTVAAETDAAQALSITHQSSQAKTITAAAETDPAQALSYQVVPGEQHVDLTAAAETDTAQTVSFVRAPQTHAITAASETDAAQAVGYAQTPQTRTLIPAGETDAAQQASISQAPISATVSAAAETNAAQPLAFTQQAESKTITPAATSDAAMAASVTQAPIEKTIGPAGETDAAVDLSIHTAVTHKIMNAAAETDTAQAIAFTQTPQTVTLTTAFSTSTAAALSFTTEPSFPPPAPPPAEPPQNPETSVTLAPATETDIARALTYAIGGVIPGDTATGTIPLQREGWLALPESGELEEAHAGRVV